MVKKSGQIFRITIKAFDYRSLDEVVKKIVLVAKDSGAIVVGPVPLPTKLQRITVNRSTFVYKDSREQFEIRNHKRIIDIKEPTPKTIELLQNISIPNGFGVKIKPL